VRTAHATKEDKEAQRKCSLGDEEHRMAGNGWRAEILWAGRVVERDEELGRGKEWGRGSNSIFKGQRRRGEEAMAGVLAINGRRAPAAYCLQEGEGD
jgi:hypothetical protein